MKTKNTKQAIGQNFKLNLSKTQKVAKAPAFPLKGKVAVNSLLSGLANEDNKTFTENGALTYKSTLNGVLDFFAMGAALRSRGDADVIQLFSKAFAQDKLLATKALFNTRNVRGGAGERKSFRIILKWLGDNYPDVVQKNLENVGFFGRYDDLYVLFGTKAEKAALTFIQKQLNQDVENYGKDLGISLLPKWLSSENASSAQTKAEARKIREFLGWTPKQYRKTLSALRAYANVVEVKMCANDWDSIDYSKVPSKASLVYKKAFPKHDKERYGQFIADVKAGKTKINAAAIFPYEIVGKILSYGDKSETLDVLWDALPNYLEGSDRNLLCVCDVSGSMSGNPMNVSISLGIYTAERNKGPFANYFISYSECPVLQKVVGNNIREKVANLAANPAYSTNLQAVFDMLLTTALKNKVKHSDMPAQIIVITDVEFNSTQNGNTNLQAVRSKYKAAGYECPQLVFWNVNSRQNNVPATADEKGVLLVSGCSPSVFKTLLSGKQYTPIDQMLETLNNRQYDRVVV